MNYGKIYDALISRARFREVPSVYCEIHHIVPRCLGGSDDESNLVHLTAEEHFVAHQLLLKLNPKNHKLAHAANMMTVGMSGKRKNKLYGWLKRRVASALSDRFKGKPLSEEHRSKLSAAAKGKRKSATHCKNLSSSLKGNGAGRTMSEETKQKIREAKLGRSLSPDTRRKIGDALKGRSRTTSVS